MSVQAHTAIDDAGAERERAKVAATARKRLRAWQTLGIRVVSIVART